MIYVEVNFHVAPHDRAKAVACLSDEAPAMRALPGNRGSRVLVDPADDSAVTLVHQWDNLESFDAYRSGPLLAKVGGVLRPMMVSAPNTVVYEAALVG